MLQSTLLEVLCFEEGFYEQGIYALPMGMGIPRNLGLTVTLFCSGFCLACRQRQR